MRFLSVYGKRSRDGLLNVDSKNRKKRMYIEKYRLHNNTKYIYGHSVELLSVLEKKSILMSLDLREKYVRTSLDINPNMSEGDEKKKRRNLEERSR